MTFPRAVDTLYLPRDPKLEEEIALRLNVNAALAIAICRKEFHSWPNGF